MVKTTDLFLQCALVLLLPEIIIIEVCICYLCWASCFCSALVLLLPEIIIIEVCICYLCWASWSFRVYIDWRVVRLQQQAGICTHKSYTVKILATSVAFHFCKWHKSSRSAYNLNSVYIVEKLVKLLLGIKAHKSAFLSGEVFFF